MPTVTIDPTQATGQPIGPTHHVSIDPTRAYGQDENGAGSFTIRELTGPDQRTVRLTQRALPYAPIVFSGVHNVEETQYVGYPRKSQQACGAGEDESEFKGQWKTRFIGDVGDRGSAMFEVTSAVSSAEVDDVEAIGVDSRQVTTAAEAAEILDDIRVKGQVVRVSWLHIARVGRLVQFTQQWHTAHDVEWSMKFKWIGKDEDAGIPSPGSASLIATTRDMSAAYVALQDATDFDGMNDLDPAFADLVDSRVGRVQRAVLELEDAIDSRASNASRALDSLRRALTISTFVRDEAEDFIAVTDATLGASMRMLRQSTDDKLGQLGIGVQLGQITDVKTDLTGVDPGAQIASSIALRKAAVAARRLKHSAARQRWATLRQLDASALAVVVVAQDEDCRALAQRFYGSPNDAEKIRQFNNLSSMTAPLGTVIVIPQQQGGA